MACGCGSTNVGRGPVIQAALGGVEVPWWFWDAPGFKAASDKCLADAQAACGGNSICVNAANEACHATLVAEYAAKYSTPPVGQTAPPAAKEKKVGTVGTNTTNNPPASYNKQPPAASKSMLSNPLVLAGIGIVAIFAYAKMQKGKK